MNNSIAASLSVEAARRRGDPPPSLHDEATAHAPPHRPGEHAGWWMVASFGTALGVAAVALTASGTGRDAILEGLRVTARLMFLPFWLAYAGGALAALFGPTLQPLKRRGRELGLAFAAALPVHLGLVAWLSLAGPAPGIGTFEVFGAAVLCTCLLALFSLGPLRRLPGAWGWWLLRNVAMNYIAYAFAIDFLRVPLLGGIRHTVMYLPFGVLAIAGPALRLAALACRVGRPG